MYRPTDRPDNARLPLATDAMHGISSQNYMESLPFLHYSALVARASLTASFPHPASHPYLPPLLNGVNGTIEGTSDDGNGVAVRFPALFNVLLDIELQHVSREAPEPPSLFWIYWLLCGTISLCVVLPFMLLYFMDTILGTASDILEDNADHSVTPSGLLSVTDSAEKPPAKGTEISPSSVATATFSVKESVMAAADRKKHA